MSADLLREAAALMRARAEAAEADVITGWPSADELMFDFDRTDAEHIASWHPAVALAVADWLDDAAENLELQEPGGELSKRWDMRVHIAGDRAIAVATTYLGRTS